MRGFFAPLRMTPSHLPSLSLQYLPLQTISSCRFPAAGSFDWLSRRGDVFDDDAAGATAGHLGDLKAAAFVLDALPNRGDVAKLGEEKPREGFNARFAGESPVQLVSQVAQGGGAIERHRSRGAEERRPADVELVFQLS